jgi:Ricin-type beta-trefoil lectin domain
MTKIRARLSATIVALLLSVGGLATFGIVTATSAQAAICPNQVYLGTIRSGLSNYLDDYGGGSGTYVHTYQFTSSNNQTWCVERASGAHAGFFIHPLNNPTGLCLDAHQDTAGYPIWVYTCNGTNAQKWCWNGHGYLTRWTNGALALNDAGRYNVVNLAQGGATQWYTNGATFADNC